MLSEIVKDVFKLTGFSNIYFLKKENLLIDAGHLSDELMIKEQLSKVISLSKVKNVLFTHLHYDHISNFHLFKNANFYASKQCILCLEKNKYETILLKPMAERFDVVLKDVKSLSLPSYLEVIYTPGHTLGSICLYHKKEKILFSGDTLFKNGVGRTDFTFSSPEQLYNSLKKLENLDVKFLCAGHDY